LVIEGGSMNKEELIKHISEEIKNGRDVDLEYTINQIPYKIKFQKPDYDDNINIPSIIAIPMTENIGNQVILESNNLESGNFEHIIEQGIETGMRLVRLTDNQPGVIVVPLIPSYREAPYFQQLSKECLELPKTDRNYRIDEQIVRIINKTKEIVKSERGIKLDDKIFLNGYSSSGVFAQRFALLHPELIGTACIGGASGSIPIPTEEFGYPIGISDYKELTGKEFDMDSYSQINFIYYVGELETQNKTMTRLDENGNPSPMHDMSYFDRSVPIDVGKRQRNILGINLFDRAEKTIEILKNLGVKIKHIVIPGRSHNNRSGIGVNELGDKIVNDTYRESLKSRQVDNEFPR
jgi:hypothetical protein